jgi:hypothetical protein
MQVTYNKPLYFAAFFLKQVRERIVRLADSGSLGVIDWMSFQPVFVASSAKLSSRGTSDAGGDLTSFPTETGNKA